MTKLCLPVKRVWAIAFIALTLMGSFAVAAQPQPMLFYQVEHGLLKTSDHFSVTVYDDGVAYAHYPEYMVKSGDYAVQLSPSEVQQVRLLLEHPLVQSFDAGDTRSAKQQLDAQSDELFDISDDSWSDFDIQLGGAQKHIRWANVGLDAKRYPQIGVIRKLAEIESMLQDLDQHPSAESISN